MICLTGDLHHASLRTANQRHCDITELQVAQRYVKMLEEADVKVTLFVTGKSLAEEWQDLQPICEHPLVEVGGHTYYCFKPALWHRAWNKINRSYNGPERHSHPRPEVPVMHMDREPRLRCLRSNHHGCHSQQKHQNATVSHNSPPSGSQGVLNLVYPNIVTPNLPIFNPWTTEIPAFAPHPPTGTG